VNVLLYVLDALRADHCSCYGYDRETTPTLDRLADEGVRFDRAYTPATWTRPVAASIVTGLYPPAHGTRTRHDRLTTTAPTLAETFRDAGYRTVGVTAMGNVSTATGFDRGFDRFRDLYREDAVVDRRTTSTATEEELVGEEGVVALPRAEDVTEGFVDWLRDERDDEPFFGFCWSIEPHVPYDPPPGSKRFRDPAYDGPVDGSRDSLKRVGSDADLAELRAGYDEEIRYNDDCLSTLLDALRDAGVYDETLVIVVGDHGDAFREHGRLTHGHAPYEELVRVPWVMRPPGGQDPLEPDALTSLVDVAPTLLDCAGIADGDGTSEGWSQSGPDGQEPVGGRSAAATLAGEEPPGHDRVFFETTAYDMQNAFYGLTDGEWKYVEIEAPDRDLGTTLDLVRYVLRRGIVTDILRNPRYYWRRYRYGDEATLYHLVTDPEEHEDVSEANSERRDEFARRLSDWRTACEAVREHAGNRDDEAIDDRTRRQLRELGYAE